MSLETAFAVTPASSGFRGTVGEEWMFAGRVFGGCVAAFASEVARAAAPHLVLGGIQGSYPRAASPGPIEGRVETIREGKSSHLLRIDLIQGDELVFTADAWMLDGRLVPTTDEPVAGAEPPESAPLVTWLEDEVAFFKNLEVRAIDYPLTPAGLGDGVPRCEVWVRGRPDLIGEATHGAAVDLLVFDSFLLECVFRSEGIGTVQPITLDLGVRWTRHVPIHAWRRLTTSATITDGIALAEGTNHTTNGTVLSTATTLGRLLRRAGTEGQS
ncbi:thioesterase family protein [Streptomyces piniterrae]|uniref:Thioesterase family protein n=1 Tax=Streptomyces piniterrae TaxID=2571125 RepID=A0A4U0NSB3_9ACTN|nr:thioesterase family protein [Streptomyces piniterrae]TJZ57340.1 thioesterase family protein [Streptomyces piniterrae]